MNRNVVVEEELADGFEAGGVHRGQDQDQPGGRGWRRCLYGETPAPRRVLSLLTRPASLGVDMPIGGSGCVINYLRELPHLN